MSKDFSSIPSNSSNKQDELVAAHDAGENPIQDAAMERAVLRKLDIWILPIATLFYFLSFLDRANIANARVAGLQKALNITNYQYSIALTLTYVPYALAELPSNLLLKFIGPNILLPTLVVSWGIVTTLQGLMHNYAGLIACRWFLGLLEGGLFPGLVLWLSMFYPRQKMQLRVSMFFAAASLSGAFSGLLAAAIAGMDGVGGKAGWAWIFMLEGIFTVIAGVIAAFFMTKTPQDAKFLSDGERAWLIKRLEDDGIISKEQGADSFSILEIFKAFKSPQVMMLGVALFFSGTNLFGLALFEPSIVADLGLGKFSATRIQLLSAPPFGVAFVVTLAGGYISDKYRCRGFTVMFFSLMALIGYVIFYVSDSPRVKYGSLFLSLPGVYGTAPALSVWNAGNSAPHVRRASAIAIGFVMVSFGGILSTWLMTTLSTPPGYKFATEMFIAFSTGMFVFSGMNLAYLRSQNKKKAAFRASGEDTNEPKGLGDKGAKFVYSL